MAHAVWALAAAWVFCGDAMLMHQKAPACGERYVDGAGWSHFLQSGVEEVVFTSRVSKLRLCANDMGQVVVVQANAAAINCSFKIQVVDANEGWVRLAARGEYVAASAQMDTFQLASSADEFRLIVPGGVPTADDASSHAIEYRRSGSFLSVHAGRVVASGFPTDVASQWRVHHVDDSATQRVATVSRRRLDEACAANRNSLVYFNDNATIESLDVVLKAVVNGNSRPPVIVLGVGHSGTSSVAHYLIKRGWAPPVLRPGVMLERSKAEDFKVLVHNNNFVQTTHVDRAPVHNVDDVEQVARRLYDAGQCWLTRRNLVDVWRAAATPQMWKDPQFVWTLHLWAPLLKSRLPPILVHVRRDPSKIVKSHRVRGETQYKYLNMSVEAAVAARVAWAEWQIRRWCGPAVSFNVGSLRNLEVKNHHDPQRHLSPSATQPLKAAASRSAPFVAHHPHAVPNRISRPGDKVYHKHRLSGVARYVR